MKLADHGVAADADVKPVSDLRGAEAFAVQLRAYGSILIGPQHVIFSCFLHEKLTILTSQGEQCCKTGQSGKSHIAGETPKTALPERGEPLDNTHGLEGHHMTKHQMRQHSSAGDQIYIPRERYSLASFFADASALVALALFVASIMVTGAIIFSIIN